MVEYGPHRPATSELHADAWRFTTKASSRLAGFTLEQTANIRRAALAKLLDLLEKERKASCSPYAR